MFTRLNKTGVSVLGGKRPNVRDDAQMSFRRVQYMRTQVEAAKAKYDDLLRQLEIAESGRAFYRGACGKCGECSACVG